MGFLAQKILVVNFFREMSNCELLRVQMIYDEGKKKLDSVCN